MGLIDLPTSAEPAVRRDVGRLEVLVDLIRGFPRLVEDLDLLCYSVLHLAHFITEWPTGSLMIRRGDVLEVAAFSGSFDPHDGSFTLRIGEGIAGKAWRDRAIVFSPDVRQDADFVAGQSTKIVSLLTCPLLVGDECIGAINVHDEIERREPSPREVEKLAILSAAASPALFTALTIRPDHNPAEYEGEGGAG